MVYSTTVSGLSASADRRLSLSIVIKTSLSVSPLESSHKTPPCYHEGRHGSKCGSEAHPGGEAAGPGEGKELEIVTVRAVRWQCPRTSIACLAASVAPEQHLAGAIRELAGPKATAISRNA